MLSSELIDAIKSSLLQNQIAMLNLYEGKDNFTLVLQISAFIVEKIGYPQDIESCTIISKGASISLVDDEMKNLISNINNTREKFSTQEELPESLGEPIYILQLEADKPE